MNTTNETMGNPLEQLQLVIEENKKLKLFKDRLQEMIAGLVALREKLESAQNDMDTICQNFDPTVQISVNGSRRKIRSSEENEEVLKTIFAWMEMGNEISTAWIQEKFPDLEYNQVTAILNRLKTSPHIESRRDGLRKFYFMKKSL